jgi:hypothetical protein
MMKGLLLAVFVAEGGAHGLGVLVAQLEDLAHFDAARERDRLAAFGAGVARLGGAQVGPEIDGEIAALFGAHVVVAVLVGAYDPVLDALQALVGADAHAFGQAHAANRALGQAGSLDLFVGEQLEAFHRAADLDLVELVVARHEDGDDGAFGVLAHHGLDRGGFGDVQELGELGNRVHAGGLDLAQGGFVVLLGVRQAGGDFGVGRPAAGAAGEFGFAGVGERVVLDRGAAADLTAVGFHRRGNRAPGACRSARRPRPFPCRSRRAIPWLRGSCRRPS